MPEALDLIVAGTAPDEVTLAAQELIKKMEDLYLPRVEQAQTFVVEIPNDPVAMGLGQFNTRLSQLRGDSNILSGWLTQAIADKRRCQARVKNAKTAYEEKLHILLTHDPDIQEVVGQQQKMSAARAKLSREARIVAYSEQIYTQMLGYHEALRLSFETLHDTKRDLMAQLAVVKQMIQIGEVDGASFPVERTGISPSRSSMQEIEVAISEELGGEGLVGF